MSALTWCPEDVERGAMVTEGGNKQKAHLEVGCDVIFHARCHVAAGSVQSNFGFP